MVPEHLPVPASDIEPGPFYPGWWCRNPNLQTLWPYFARRRPLPVYQRQRLELGDGDFLDLDWHRSGSDGPLCLLLHGLEGCSRSHYIRGMVGRLAAAGVDCVALHHRGCSGEPNRLPRRYHAGDTADLAQTLKYLHQLRPGAPLFAIGFSLGGNILLKWLGEFAADAHQTVDRAIAVSVPFRLADTVARTASGFSRLYQWRLVSLMREATRRKFRAMPSPIEFGDLERLRTFRQFDDAVTAPLHGFDSVDQYYRQSSCRRYLADIRVPTLIVHALDDPFMFPASVPRADELSPSVELDLQRHGGHCGFVAGPWPWRADYWLERKAIRFFARSLSHRPHAQASA